VLPGESRPAQETRQRRLLHAGLGRTWQRGAGAPDTLGMHAAAGGYARWTAAGGPGARRPRRWHAPRHARRTRATRSAAVRTTDHLHGETNLHAGLVCLPAHQNRSPMRPDCELCCGTAPARQRKRQRELAPARLRRGRRGRDGLLGAPGAQGQQFVGNRLGRRDPRRQPLLRIRHV